VKNSFESPDSINAIDWSLKTKNKNVIEYVKGLIKMTREHPAFRMINAKQIADHIQFRDNDEKGIVSYIINGQAINDRWKKIVVFFNGNNGKRTGILPPGKWKMAIWDNDFTKNTLTVEKEFFMQAYSCSILYQDN
jgi:pullulanase